MTAIASTDLTLTVQTGTIQRFNKYKEALVKIAFGNGTLTYPPGGVPLPSFVASFTSYGMKKTVNYLELVDQDDSQGIIWKYDHDNKKLRGYLQGAVITAASTGTLDDYPLDTTAEPLAAAANQPSSGAISLGLTNTAAAGTIFLGKLVELASTHAPAAQTLYVRVSGQ